MSDEDNICRELVVEPLEAWRFNRPFNNAQIVLEGSCTEEECLCDVKLRRHFERADHR